MNEEYFCKNIKTRMELSFPQCQFKGHASFVLHFGICKELLFNITAQNRPQKCDSLSNKTTGNNCQSERADSKQ